MIEIEKTASSLVKENPADTNTPKKDHHHDQSLTFYQIRKIGTAYFLNLNTQQQS
jgi:hypothetical protein